MGQPKDRLRGVAILLVMLPPAAQACGDACFGRWLTPDKDAVIEVSRCGNEICGLLVAFDSTGYPNRDQQNPQRDLRGRPLCGLRVLGGRIGSDDQLLRGWVYDASDGKKYDLSGVRQRDPDTLVLELRMAFFTHDIALHRVTSGEIASCARS